MGDSAKLQERLATFFWDSETGRPPPCLAGKKGIPPLA